MAAVAQKLGIGSTETLRKWVRQAEIDAGDRPDLSSEEHAEIKRLKQENADRSTARSVQTEQSAAAMSNARANLPCFLVVGQAPECPVVLTCTAENPAKG